LRAQVELEQVVVTRTGGAAENGRSAHRSPKSSHEARGAGSDSEGRMLSAKVTGLRSTTVGGGVGTSDPASEEPRR
jgi:hypothetical protein